jgi:hypothetical protein
MISNHLPAPIRVLVLMPMLPGYEAVRETVAAAVADAKLEIVWLKELLEDWEWLDWLYASVRQCDLILADPSKHNAFVMYELGVARVNARPTLIVLDCEDSQLSGSLDGSPFLLYSKDELDIFSDQLRADLSILARVAVTQTRSELNPAAFYCNAVNLLKCFTAETGQSVEVVDEDAFTARLSHSMRHGTFISSLAGTSLGEAALLAALIRSSRMVGTMTAIREWVDLRKHD